MKKIKAEVPFASIIITTLNSRGFDREFSKEIYSMAATTINIDGKNNAVGRLCRSQ